MVRELEIRRENVLPTTPEQIWDAVATGPGNLGWLYPMEIEPWEGGVVSRGPMIVTVWDPPRRFACRLENENYSAALEYHIDPQADASTALRVVIRRMYNGVVGDDDAVIDGVTKHSDFYQHTLGQYLKYFSGRNATYVEAQGPAASTENDAFTVLRRALGIADDATEGAEVRLVLTGFDPLDTVVDYLTPHFIGLRSTNGLYRFFGRNTWGMPVGLSLHLFADDVDEEMTEQAWRVWLDGVFTQ